MAAWYSWLGLLAAALALLHGTNWATSGFWSATGGFLFVAIIAALAWTLVTSVLLSMRVAETERPPDAAVTRPT